MLIKINIQVKIILLLLIIIFNYEYSCRWVPLFFLAWAPARQNVCARAWRTAHLVHLLYCSSYSMFLFSSTVLKRHHIVLNIWVLQKFKIFHQDAISGISHSQDQEGWMTWKHNVSCQSLRMIQIQMNSNLKTTKDNAYTFVCSWCAFITRLPVVAK